VLTLAQEEARSLNHSYLGTEHVLLGLLREHDGVGGRMLREAGCSLEKVRQMVQFIVGSAGQGVEQAGELPLTPRLKEVLQLAVEEAKRLNHTYIGTEHLVLGLIEEGEGVAGRILRDLGLELSAARDRVVEMLQRGKA
jgi:ATP-dependent Clp protease ATP-binding subunit ClpC